jgi:hypothetical protein
MTFLRVTSRLVPVARLFPAPLLQLLHMLRTQLLIMQQCCHSLLLFLMQMPLQSLGAL